MSSSEGAASQEAAAAAACEASPASTATPPAELRIVLVGRTGAGRSSSGNTILGRSAFGVDASPCSVTTECQRQAGTVAGRRVSVIDTPGFLHTHLPPRQLLAEVGRCVALSSPGPHVFLVTLRPGRFTQEERDALKWVTATFGPGAAGFTVALFTCGDQLHGKSIESFLEASGDLSEFVGGCQGGYHVLHNGIGPDETTACSQQVAALLEKIDKVVADNGGGCYSDEMFQEAERAIRDAQERILEETGRAVAAEAGEKEERGPESGSSRRREEEARRGEEEEARKREEKVFWCELVTALGKGAAEGVGIMGKDKGKGKAVKKSKVVALATSPLSISSAAKAVGGAVREGTKVLYKHRKTFLH